MTKYNDLNIDDLSTIEQFCFLEHLMLGYEIKGVKGPDVQQLGQSMSLDDMCEELAEAAYAITGDCNWNYSSVLETAICAAAEGANLHHLSDLAGKHWYEILEKQCKYGARYLERYRTSLRNTIKECEKDEVNN